MAKQHKVSKKINKPKDKTAPKDQYLKTGLSRYNYDRMHAKRDKQDEIIHTLKSDLREARKLYATEARECEQKEHQLNKRISGIESQIAETDKLYQTSMGTLAKKHGEELAQRDQQYGADLAARDKELAMYTQAHANLQQLFAAQQILLSTNMSELSVAKDFLDSQHKRILDLEAIIPTPTQPVPLRDLVAEVVEAAKAGTLTVGMYNALPNPDKLRLQKDYLNLADGPVTAARLKKVMM